MAARDESPFGATVGLGRVAGVPLRAHWSVLGLLLLVTILLGAQELPALRPGNSSLVNWSLAAVTSVLFFLQLCAHELAHAVTARHYGLPVKRMTLWLLGGLTELEGEPASARADAAIAASGPLVTLGFAAVFGGLAVALGEHAALGGACAWLALMNIVLAVFNLMPAAPLDGGRILRAVVWARTGDRRRAAAVAGTAGRLVGTFLIALGVLETLAGYLGGLWLALIGWFVIGGAQSERYAGLSERLQHLPAGAVMVPTPLSCPTWWTIDVAIAQLGPESARQPALPIVDVDGSTAGAITVADLERVPAGKRAELRVGQLVRRRPATVGEATPLSEVAAALQAGPPIVVVVDEQQRPLGVIDPAVLDRVARLAGLRHGTTVPR